MKKYTKTVVALAIMLVVSAIGFGTAFGYGSSYGTGGSGGSTYIPTPVVTPAPVIAPAPVVTPVSSTTAPVGKVLGVETFIFNIDLGVGMTNDDVKELQTRLTAEGVYSGPIMGTFGPLTKAAVRAYQTKKGISPTGFVGPMTRAALNGTTTNTTTNTTGGISIKQFVELLISIGAISPEKAAAARAAAGL